MADLRKRLPANVEGEFYVDSTCINCDTCRQLAPSVFGETDDFSFVYAQPQDDVETRNALRALLACPTASIGAAGKSHAKEVVSDFPLALDGGVYYCGFNSPKSYGGNSYFIVHPDGNWMVDSPRYVEPLARRLEALGGVRHIFLTHRDDVADVDKYARRFGSRRIIHRHELSSQPDAEQVIDGIEPVMLAPDFVAIPAPGHTRGHCVLLYRNRFLFTGDHLWWSRERRRLNAGRSVCWYSWPKQAASMASLRNYSFEWVLPGHGGRVRQSPDKMRAQLDGLIAEMKAVA
ncbi:MAG: MBL fold metallo-hydrolase [Bryobacteraceae bacterium]